MTEHRRAVSFGRDAGAYDASRPGYPREAVEHIVGLTRPTDAVEIGAGTGIATRSFARDGLRLVCLEPSEQMASVLRSAGLPGVEIVITTFEDWEGAQESVGLIYAAQSWHWVDPETGFAKARSILRPDGVLALMWNIPTDRYTHLDSVYQNHAPELLAENDERIRRRDTRDWREDLAAAGFRDVSRFTHEWTRELTAAGYRALCSTYSDHILLESEKRQRLLDAIEEAIVERGDRVVVEYRTRVYTGRR